MIPACGLPEQAGTDSTGQRRACLQTFTPAAILRLMQPQPAFDTYAFVKSLTEVGMPEDQAEILSKGQADLYERLVTKEYFEFTLNHELEKLRAELKNDIERVRAELKNDIERFRAELKNDNEKLRAELEQKFNQQEAALKEMEYKLTIKLGAMLTIGITILGALFTLLTTAAS